MRLNDIKNILEVKGEGLKTGGNLILQFLCPGVEAKTPRYEIIILFNII